MKKSIIQFLAIVLLLSISCTSKVEKDDGFLIHAKIKGLENGTALLAKLDLATNEQVDVDSTEIRNGEFIFKGNLDSPYLHTIFINGDADKIHLFLENSKINIDADIKDLERTKIHGSREDSLFRSIKMDNIFDRKKGMNIMLKYPDYTFSAFTAYYQFQIHNIESDTLSLIMDNFKAPVKNSIYYAHLEKLYETLKKVAISAPAPKFSIPDPEGNLVNLEDFKGQYVLIDFWASWCAPCRAANPSLVKTYELFKEKNFTILGISVDKDKKRWIDAIEADGLTWTNLSNLEGWDDVSNNYGVKAIPQNFLIDPNGVIIDKNIEPEFLKKKLDEIFEKLEN